MYRVSRYHDICCGHRVYGHESKCAHLHGHNYRIHFLCESEALDKVGRVIDFSVIKERLCMWIEHNWDHRFLIWEKDPAAIALQKLDSAVEIVSFNPTAEAMAKFLFELGNVKLEGSGVKLVRVTVEETAKCQAYYE